MDKDFDIFAKLSIIFLLFLSVVFLGNIAKTLDDIQSTQQEMRYPMEHRIYLDPPDK